MWPLQVQIYSMIKKDRYQMHSISTFFPSNSRMKPPKYSSFSGPNSLLLRQYIGWRNFYSFTFFRTTTLIVALYLLFNGTIISISYLINCDRSQPQKLSSNQLQKFDFQKEFIHFAISILAFKIKFVFITSIVDKG